MPSPKMGREDRYKTVSNLTFTTYYFLNLKKQVRPLSSILQIKRTKLTRLTAPPTVIQEIPLFQACIQGQFNRQIHGQLFNIKPCTNCFA